MPKVFLTPLLIAGLLFLPSCTSKENLTTNSVRKFTEDEIKKIAAPELDGYKFEKYVCSGPQTISKSYENLAITLSKAWSQRYFMLDLEHVNADKIKIDLGNANNVAMFIELSIILENNFCFTDEEIREAKEDLESLLKTLE
jgi:hypothetical protein